MSALKIIEKIVGIRQEILKVSEQLNHLQSELDLQVDEMIQFLRHKKIIEKKS